jgi:hypothetical protein
MQNDDIILIAGKFKQKRANSQAAEKGYEKGMPPHNRCNK